MNQPIEMHEKVRAICRNIKCCKRLGELQNDYFLCSFRFQQSGNPDDLIGQINKEIEIEETINECFLKSEGEHCTC